MLRPLQAFLILSLYFSYSNAVYQENIVTRGLSNRLHVLDPPVDPSLKSAANEFFEQRLDHFDALNNQKWMQRYFSRYLCVFKIHFYPMRKDNNIRIGQ